MPGSSIKIMKHNIFLPLLFSLFASCFSTGITVPQASLNKEPKEEISSVNPEEIKETYLTGVVKEIISDTEEELPGGNKQRFQNLLITILSGQEKGKERPAINVIPDNPAFSVVGEVGRKYLITKVENLKTGQEDYFLVDYYRQNFVWLLVLVFIVVLLAVGGLKGFRAIVSLFATILFIAFILIPGIEKGINPLLAAVLVSLLSTAVTMLLVAGWNFKSLASTLGTVIGVSFSGLISMLVIKFAPLSGLASSEAQILWGNQYYEINFKGLLAAGMIVSCLGAVMDVAISIASSIQEIKTANPNYLLKDLFKAGMNVGKDIMGTMTNTLVLAYTGMAMPLLLLISHEKLASKFLNLELVVSEVTAAIAGSVGLIVSVPTTAIIMAYLMSRKK